MRLRHKFRDRDLNICGFAEMFQKNVVTTYQFEFFFEFLTLFRPVFIVFLPANTIEKKLVELQFYQAIYPSTHAKDPSKVCN